MIERLSYGGWPNCYRMSDGKWEVIVTSDVGPRAIRFGFVGGRNVFAEFKETMGLTGGDEWRIYGGHRFWHSPEAKPRSYVPDNGPVDVSSEHDNVLRVVQPTEAQTGIQKELAFALTDGCLTVTHVLHNRGLWPVTLAPWALSVMAPGGLGVIPQPASHDPDNLLPNRIVVLWPYTDMADERIHWGTHYVTVRQDVNAGPTKVGLNASDGWLAYLNEGVLFVKRFSHQPGGVYPDGGCCVEMYTNQQFLEAETLGPLAMLGPGDCTTHVERWYLFTPVSLIDSSEGAIDREIKTLADSVR